MILLFLVYFNECSDCLLLVEKDIISTKYSQGLQKEKPRVNIKKIKTYFKILKLKCGVQHMEPASNG